MKCGRVNPNINIKTKKQAYVCFFVLLQKLINSKYNISNSKHNLCQKIYSLFSLSITLPCLAKQSGHSCHASFAVAS